MTHVVVIGAGFAGLSAVRALQDSGVRVTLVDRNGYNTFQPLLYQVATGGLNPGDVTYPVREFTARHRWALPRRAGVTGIDPGNQTVSLDDGGADLHYDYLIIATGVTANFFGIPGADSYSHGMYTRRDAIAVRDRLFDAIDRAATLGEDREDFRVVVVGGGATGVEMAGSLAELRNTTLSHVYPELDPSRVHVVLVEMGKELLAPFQPRQRAYAATALRARGVVLRLGTAVKEVREDCVVLDDSSTLHTDLVVWASGVAAPDSLRGWGLKQAHAGRLQVGRDLRALGQDRIFAVGDIAEIVDDPLPQLAQPALQTGEFAGNQIAALLTNRPTGAFRYVDKGIMATIGRRSAVAEIAHGPNLRGTLAWLAWLALHLVTLLGNRNRLVTLVNLAWRYVRWPRNATLIVGR